jgi:hypothetical protein
MTKETTTSYSRRARPTNSVGSKSSTETAISALISALMVKKFMSLLAAVAVIGGGATLFAQGGAKSGEGTLSLQDKNYTLSHGLAYETEVNGENVIAVVLSGQAISNEDLTKSKAEEKKGGFADFKRPYLILNFAKTGELKSWSAATSNTSIGNRNAGKATGELKLQEGKVSGKASQPRDAEGMFPTAFDVRFDTKLLAAGESLPATVKKPPGPAANVKPTVTGLFKGNGKEAKIAYVSAYWDEPFSGKQSIVLVFTEKDHSKDKKPKFNASFSKFGSALIISLHEDGGIFGCQVVHSAHKKQGFSSIGQIRTNNFRYEDGKVEGELLTDKELEFFGDTWEVNLKFVAPLGEIPKEFQVPEKKTEKPATDMPATDTPATKKQSTEDTEDENDDEDEKTTSKPAADQFNVKDLALTKDASQIEYKEIVAHVLFKSKLGPKAAVTELTANLKAQGWTKEGVDLFTPASTILKRKRGGATLTIFVKPEGGGSDVKIFTEGLAWEGK